MKLLQVLLLLWMAAFTSRVTATPGRVDSLGCHYSKKYGMHCHQGEVREKRLQRECRGRPNAGACLGRTRQ